MIPIYFFPSKNPSYGSKLNSYCEIGDCKILNKSKQPKDIMLSNIAADGNHSTIHLYRINFSREDVNIDNTTLTNIYISYNK